MHVAVNGWSLAAEPATPFRYHLLSRLLSLAEVQPRLQITLMVPEGGAESVPSPLAVEPISMGRSPWARLRFDQRQAPLAAGQIGADLLLDLSGQAPLRSPVPLAVELSRGEEAGEGGFGERLRRAVGGAGALGAALRYGWADRPLTGVGSRSARRLEPFVADGFRPTNPGNDRQLREQAGFPSEYVLCHGAERVDLPLLLAAWTWVEAAVADVIPLVFLGMGNRAREDGSARAVELGMAGAVRWIEGVEIAALPAVYRGAASLLHPGYTRTGQELRWALATGTPVAAIATDDAAAIVGDASYLVESGHARALGAAALTLLVEERELAQRLREKGLIRAGEYHQSARVEAYAQALSETVKRK